MVFPFMALGSFAVNAPAAQVLGRPLDPVIRRVFRLPGCCAAPIIMSLFSERSIKLTVRYYVCDGRVFKEGWEAFSKKVSCRGS